MSSSQDTFAISAMAPTAAPRIAFRPHRALPWLLLPQGVPLQILIDAVPVQVPNTRSWFRGVVSQRGNLIPVFDLAEWAGYPPDASESAQIVAIGLGAQACAMRCSDTPTLLNIAQTAGASALEGPLAPYAADAYDSTLGKVHEFDVQQWLLGVAHQVSNIGS